MVCTLVRKTASVFRDESGESSWRDINQGSVWGVLVNTFRSHVNKVRGLKSNKITCRCTTLCQCCSLSAFTCLSLRRRQLALTTVEMNPMSVSIFVVPSHHRLEPLHELYARSAVQPASAVAWNREGASSSQHTRAVDCSIWIFSQQGVENR